MAVLLHMEILGQALSLDVHGCVGLPMENRAAMGTGPSLPPGGNFLRHDAAAGGAGSGGGEIAVNDEKLLSLPRQLVAQAFPESTKPGIEDISQGCDLVERTQPVRSYTHGVPCVGYPPGFLVDVVAALVGDMIMELVEF